MSSRYAFLTSRRWVVLIAVVVAVSVACVLLGYWQWTRYQGRAEQIDLVEANYHQDPVPLGDLVPTPQAPLDPSDQWRPVQVTGEYLGDVVVLPQRGVGGTPADHVVGMLLVSDAPGGPWVVLVDRGWYTTDTFADHSAAQVLPDGQVETVLRLRTAEEPSPRVLDAGQIHRLNPAQGLTAATGHTPAAVDATLATGIYGQLAAETQGGAGAVPAGLSLLPQPAADLGSHLSYALQWWVFALGCYVALVVLARREAQDPQDAPVHIRRRVDNDEDADVEAQIQASATSSA